MACDNRERPSFFFGCLNSSPVFRRGATQNDPLEVVHRPYRHAPSQVAGGMPPDDRDAWQNLWKDADALLAKTRENKERRQCRFSVIAGISRGWVACAEMHNILEGTWRSAKRTSSRAFS